MESKQATSERDVNVEPLRGKAKRVKKGSQSPLAADHENRFAKLARGERVPDIEQMPPHNGFVSNLWNPYIGRGSRLAAKGMTGAEVCQLLCAMGVLEYDHEAETIAAGTPIKNQPSYKDVRTANPPYRFLTRVPLSKQAFLSVVSDKERLAALIH